MKEERNEASEREERNGAEGEEIRYWRRGRVEKEKERSIVEERGGDE